MLLRRQFTFIAVFVSLLAGLLTELRPATAQEPAGVVRTFGFYATGATVGPDFIGDDSLGVVVLPAATGTSPSMLEFSLIDDNGPLAGSLWSSRPAEHLTKGPKSSGGIFYWLLTEDTPTPPPGGSVAFTSGPQASVLWSASGRIALCNGDCCSGDDNFRWRVVEVGGNPFVIVTAVFTR